MSAITLYIWYNIGDGGGAFSDTEGWWWQSTSDRAKHGPYGYRSTARAGALNCVGSSTVEYGPPPVKVAAVTGSPPLVEEALPLDSDLATLYDNLNKRIESLAETESRVSRALAEVRQELAGIKAELPDKAN